MHSSLKRKVKIVCTLGPSSSSEEMLSQLMLEGMNVARLNFSHGDHAFHRDLYQRVRKTSEKSLHTIGILQDLQGPKIRVGKLVEEGLTFEAGDEVLVYPDGAVPDSVRKGQKILPIHPDVAGPISGALVKGAQVLFDDGKLIARVKSIAPPLFVIEFITGGKLTRFKGMNFPGSPLPIPSCTNKDLEDLKLGLDLGVDFVALSFVRSAQDILQLKEQIRKYSNHRPSIIAKIEREEAIDVREQIVAVTDGILIARGDMAVEVGAERVPIVQKQLIHSCNQFGIPVITATQMLESMISSPTPTRAEATDVANAVFDGTDAVMLSGETASGQYPLEAVRTMVRVIQAAEQNLEAYSRRKEVFPQAGSVVDSVEFSASRIAMHIGASAIACLTHSGTAARVLSKYRPPTPIVAVMDRQEALRQLSLVWGVHGVIISDIVGTDDLFAVIEEALLRENWVNREELIVVTAGIPTLRRGTTNMVKVHRVGDSSGRAQFNWG